MTQHAYERSSKPKLKNCLITVALVLIPFLIYAFYWHSTSGRLSLILLILSFVAMLLGLLILYTLRRLDSIRASLTAYAAILSFFCLLFVFIFPPLTVADEDHHFAATYWMANCVTGSGSWNDSSTLLMRPEDEALLFEETNPRVSDNSYRQILERATLFADSSETVVVDIDEHFSLSISRDNLVTKIPSIIGVIIARALNLGAYPLFYFGRIFSCLAYIICCVIAVKKTPIAKPAFVVASLLPMSLNLAASYSYDCGIISLSFLFLSYALKGIFDDGKLQISDQIVIFLSAALLAPCKVIYSLEFLLVFLIPTSKFSSKRIGIMFKIGVLIGALASIMALRFANLAAMTTGKTSTSVMGAEPFTIATLIQHPSETALIFIRTLIEQGDFYINSAIGAYLGWIQSELGSPFYFIIGYILCSLYSVQPSVNDSITLSFRHKVAFFAICTGILLASMLALLLDWTSFGSNIIQGVQGRYLLPAIPLIFMLFRSGKGRLDVNTLPFSFVCMATINAFYMIQFFARVLLLT